MSRLVVLLAITVGMTAGCYGMAGRHDFAGASVPSLPLTLDELSRYVVSWERLGDLPKGNLTVVIRPGSDGTAVVEYEYRDDRPDTRGIRWAKTRMDAPSFRRLMWEILALCQKKNRFREDLALPLLFLDGPEGERLAIQEDFCIRDLPLSEQRFSIHDCPGTVHSLLEELFFEKAGLEGSYLKEACGEHPSPILDPFEVLFRDSEDIERNGFPEGYRYDSRSPACEGFRGDLPGVFHHRFSLGGLIGPHCWGEEGEGKLLPEEVFRKSWHSSSVPIRFAMLANHLRHGSEGQKARAARAIARLVVNRYGSSDACPHVLGEAAGLLLSAVMEGKEKGEEWAGRLLLEMENSGDMNAVREAAGE